jgi:hypothetical protein
MTTKLNRSAYEQLVVEDLEWLDKQPRTLEREHIRVLLEQSADLLYGTPPMPVNTGCWEVYPFAGSWSVRPATRGAPAADVWGTEEAAATEAQRRNAWY